jgi:cytochrome c-type biogenesis protein CcmH
MLWAIFAALTGIAVLAVLWPLARRPRETSPIAHDVAFYRAQLDEIARDGGEAGLSHDEAEAAKAEAARRLIAASERADRKPLETSRLAMRITATVVLIFIPLITLGLYDRLGHPDWPDAPLQARLDAPLDHMDINVAVARVEAHLAQHPDDARGYEVLIPIYIRLGRFDDAVRMAQTALERLGTTPQRLVVLGETLMAGARGEVTDAAAEAFTKAEALDNPPPEALFYLGLAAAQKGDFAKAREIWQKLLDTAPQDAPWRKDLTARIAALSEARPDNVPPGGETIAALPEAQREQAIRGMVARLAQRLAENGQDLDGWLRLMRSYVMLKDVDKARAALDSARKNFDADPAGRARIDALARELGLDS